MHLQAGMQRFMTMYRFAAIVLMIGTMAIKLAHEWHLVPGRIDKVGWFNFAQFAAIFGPSFQALANQVREMVLCRGSAANGTEELPLAKVKIALISAMSSHQLPRL
jgi:hypothetical protein